MLAPLGDDELDLLTGGHAMRIGFIGLGNMGAADGAQPRRRRPRGGGLRHLRRTSPTGSPAPPGARCGAAGRDVGRHHADHRLAGADRLRDDGAGRLAGSALPRLLGDRCRPAPARPRRSPPGPGCSRSTRPCSGGTAARGRGHAHLHGRRHARGLRARAAAPRHPWARARPLRRRRAGQAAKFCNNLILGVSMVGVCEAFALATKLGLDPHALYDVVSTSSGNCWSVTSYCPVPGVGPTSPADHDYRPGLPRRADAEGPRPRPRGGRDRRRRDPARRPRRGALRRLRRDRRPRPRLLGDVPLDRRARPRALRTRPPPSGLPASDSGPSAVARVRALCQALEMDRYRHAGVSAAFTIART